MVNLAGSKKSFLVIGGAGLLGVHVVQQLHQRGDVVDLVDLVLPRVTFAERVKTYLFDIADVELMRHELSSRHYDAALWCIDLAHQPNSKAALTEQFRHNLRRLRSALAIMAEMGIKRLVFIAGPELLRAQSSALQMLGDLAAGFAMQVSVIIVGELQGGLYSCAREWEHDHNRGGVDTLLRVVFGQRLFFNLSDLAELSQQYAVFDVADVARLCIQHADTLALPEVVGIEAVYVLTGGAQATLQEWRVLVEEQVGSKIAIRSSLMDSDSIPPLAALTLTPMPALTEVVLHSDPSLLAQRSLRRMKGARKDDYLSVLDELQRRFPSATTQRWFALKGMKAWWKRLAWRSVINSAWVFKRTLDVMVSVLAILLLMPLFIVSALIIKSQDGGPVLFWQMRVGTYGREFPFPKFRSMVVNAEIKRMALLDLSHHKQAGCDVTFKMRRDPRVTPYGRIIRKLSIDELPQLWCVLTGEMSLVGPRPPLPSEVDRYTLNDRRRLSIKPGLTCIWQVSGRSDIAFAQQVELDAQYITSQSFYLDIKLLLKTVPAVLFGRGAY